MKVCGYKTTHLSMFYSMSGIPLICFLFVLLRAWCSYVFSMILTLSILIFGLLWKRRSTTNCRFLMSWLTTCSYKLWRIRIYKINKFVELFSQRGKEHSTQKHVIYQHNRSGDQAIYQQNTETLHWCIGFQFFNTFLQITFCRLLSKAAQYKISQLCKHYRNNIFGVNDPVPKRLRSRVVYNFSCTSRDVCYVGESNLKHLATHIREHLFSDRASRVYKPLESSEACRPACTSDIFYLF